MSATATATMTTKPKLTGWAQAAARAVPKTQSNGHHKSNSSSSHRVNNKNTNNNDLHNEQSSHQHKRNKKIARQPYNRAEVKKFMKDLYDSHINDISLKTYKEIIEANTNNSHWGSVTSNKNKSKKYGCLNEIAKVLKN